MDCSALLFRRPIVNRSREAVGYDVSLVSSLGEMAPLGGIAALLRGKAGQTPFFDRLPNRFALADCLQVEVDKPDAAAGRFVLGLSHEHAPEDLPVRARQWKAAGFGLCLDAGDPNPWPGEILQQASYLRLDATGGQLERASGQLRKYPGKQIAAAVHTRKLYDAALQAGFDLCQGYFFTEPTVSESAVVNPSYNSIVTLMQLAQDNAPVARIEEVFKRDAALSFKLLRYINSAGFGLSCEIQSFKHAVAVLGYQNLYKWLTLLLVTAAREQNPPALVTTAIARGRLAELLGQNLFEAHERDNLFIAGAFSLLHVILQMPLEKIAEQVVLPDTVNDALFHHAGPYGPVLELVELTERLDQDGAAPRAAELALSLGLSDETLNRAQLDALAWAEGLGR
jgi:EAL and modified HD-GYP domain-containing signal transduction protein